jgi:hypothetical protein
MEEMMSRIKLRLGEFEVEYDGEQKFITDGLLNLAKNFLVTAGDESSGASAGAGLKIKRRGMIGLSTSSIAQKLGAKTGPDLAIAAAAHLVIVKKMDKFTHTELVAEMKEAKTFYKNSYHKNLGAYLKTLVTGGRFNHIGGNDYALSENEIKDLEAKLA